MDQTIEIHYYRELYAANQEQQHDSGCGLDTTLEDDIVSQSNETSQIILAAKLSLSRRERCRKSLKRLREKSAKFFKSEITPSCLKMQTFTEMATDVTRNVEHAPVRIEKIASQFTKMDYAEVERTKSAPVLRQRLVRQLELSSCESIPHSPILYQSVKSVHSECSLASESQGIIWVKERSTPSPILLDATPTFLLPRQVMDLYQQVLSCIINPLGSPDRSGFTKDDILCYIQEVFHVDRSAHESALAEAQKSKPSDVILSVTVFEAKDLKPCGTIDATNASCVLGIDASQSPCGTPSSSPCVTPSTRRKHRLSVDTVVETDDFQRLDGRLSFPQIGLDKLEIKKTLKRRTPSSLDIEEFVHTETVKSTVNPIWGEQFQLNVADLNTDALHLFIWHQPTINQQEMPEKFNHRSRPSFKSLFRHLRLSQDGCRSFANCLGQIRIPLKEIPTCGSCRWYQLYRDKRQKIVQSGRIRLGLHLSLKSENDVRVRERRLKEFYFFIRKIYDHELGVIDCIDNSQTESREEESHLHNLISQQIICCALSQYAQYMNIGALSQNLLELCVLLEISICILPTLDRVIVEQISAMSEVANEETEGIDQLTMFELETLTNSVSAYVGVMKRKIMMNKPRRKFFPPTEVNLVELETRTRSVKSLTKLQKVLGGINSSTDLFAYLAQCIQNDVREWLTEHLESVQTYGKDVVLEKTRQFVEVLRQAAISLTPLPNLTSFFNDIGIDYYRIASIVAEPRLSSRAKELAMEMDKYQIRYHRFEVNVTESSAVSLNNYFALRTLFNKIRVNVSERELFRISLSDYQNWFKTSVTFWLQTFREQCLARMETALRLDKDMVQVTSLVRHSNSSVDVLSCFNTMITEWRDIDFADTDIALLGVTKITDTICDCVKAYMDKVIEIMEHNGYYDYIDNQQFDVTDRLCISLNNISHLSQYLMKLPTQLNWQGVTLQLSLKHENEEIGQRALKMLQTLVQTTDEEMQAEGRILAKQIIDRMAIDLQKYTTLFTRCPSANATDVEPLLEYLERNMEVLFQKLESNLFPLFWEEIWKTEIRIISETLAQGKPPTYYKDVSAYLESLRLFFQREGVENCRNRSCKLYCNLLKVLEMNSLSSEQLVLRYYSSLADVSATPSDYYGHLVVKVGFRPTADELISIHVSVIQAKELPGMTNVSLSNPFVTICLCPQTLFKETKSLHTPVQKATVNPVYGENFELSLPEGCRRTEGAVLVLSVWHYVPLFTNDFLGEVVLPLTGLRELIGRQTVDDLPAIMMPLRRPKEPKHGPYKVLKDRSSSDKVAQVMLSQRSKEVVFRTRCNLCKPVKCIVSTLTGKKLEVIGKQASISTD